MAELNLDFSRSSANGLLPEGWYYAFIYHIEPKRSDRARWIECQFKLMQEPAMDRLLTVRIFTDNSTGLKRLSKLNQALGIEIDYRDWRAFVGIPIRVFVAQKDATRNFPAHNDITKYEPSPDLQGTMRTEKVDQIRRERFARAEEEMRSAQQALYQAPQMPNR